MRVETSSGIVLEYDAFGSPADPTVVLIMGFGTQFIGWDAEFCGLPAARGRHVIRYDNRDCGLSTKYHDAPVDLMDFITAVTSGEFDRALAMTPYSLRDMADDGIGLLQELGIQRARGGLLDGWHDRAKDGDRVPQPRAVADFDDVLDWEPEFGQSTPEAQEVLFSPRPADRDGYIAAAEQELVWASRRYGDPAALRALAAASYDRSYYPAGVPRQLAAMILDRSRADALRNLDLPTLVIHSQDDTLIDPSGGRRTAELVPDARFLLIENMGHDRPRSLRPGLVDVIHEHTEGGSCG